jgi:hypothetical protein
VPGRPARGRLFAVVSWVLAAEVATFLGAAFGFAVVGRNSLLLLPWLAPGVVLMLIALERIERYRGRGFAIWSGRALPPGPRSGFRDPGGDRLMVLTR